MLSVSAAPLRALFALTTLALVAGGLSATEPAAAAASDISVTGLRANNLENPLGIAGEAPSLSWRTESTGRGVTQESYEIRVAESEENLGSTDIWNTDAVESDEQLNVVYGGPDLESSTRYFWQVRVTDNRGNTSSWSDVAWFETALLSTTEWQGSWVAGADPVPWTEYTVSADFTLKPSTAFGFYLRSTNVSNGYMWQLNDETAGHPRLRPHVRVNNVWTKLPEVDLTTMGLAADVLKSRATVEIALSGSTITTKVNGTAVDTRTNTQFSSGYFGPRADISTAEEVTFHSISVSSPAGTLYESAFGAGQNPFGAGTITAGNLVIKGQTDALYQPATSLPILRRDFTTTPGKTIASARVYASARGNYELAVNGDKVGDQELAPGWTDYSKRFQYQTYDITDQLAEGANTIGAFLADGWYSGHIAWYGADKYGTQNALLAQLEVTYTDGSTQTIATNSSWKTASGPVQAADLLMGETYNANLEQDGWSEPGFNDETWAAATIATGSSTTLLHPQADEPVRVTGERPAVTRTEAPVGSYIYDVGQNLSGVAKVTLSGVAGQKVTIRYAEVLNKNGTMYVANLRSAKATDYYTFAETGTVTWRPRFTSHGFRYIEISGVTTAPSTNNVTALVYGSDLEASSTFETSDAMLNQLHSNIVWGQRGNFVSVPTDTPARDERLGYSGDLNAFAGTATFNFDSLAFIKKWMKDMRDTQTADGEYPESAPRGPGQGCCDGGSAWSDGGIAVPWMAYKRYGDTGIIADNWASMEKYMAYLNTNFPTRVRADGPYGDWLDLGDPTPANVIGTAYYAYDARLMSEMAEAVGNTEDAASYKALAEEVTDVFVDRFVAADGTITGNSQTAYALALGMDLVPAETRQAAGDKLVAKLKSRDFHLSTGFVGTPWLMPALSGTGNWDAAYRLLTTKTLPSWGFEVEMGATTMWERWDSIDNNGNFGDPAMNSFNHYAFGAVGDWMYQHIGGIQVGDAGYESFTIAPHPGGGISHATTTYDSTYGEIGSDWSVNEGVLTLATIVPTNTTATIRIPAANAWGVSESGDSLDNAPGVTLESEDGDEVVVTVGSGEYEFTVLPEGVALGDIIAAIDELEPGAADELIADARSSAVDAAGLLLGNRAAATSKVLQSLASIRAARATTDTSALRAIESDLGAVATRLSGLEVTITRTGGTLVPGDDSTVTVALSNTGTATLSDVTVALDGWQGAELDSVGTLAPAATSSTEFELTVPDDQLPGTAELPVTVTFTLAGTALTATQNVNLEIDSELEVTTVIATPTAITPDSKTSVAVTVHNDGAVTATGRVRLDVPEHWLAPPVSAALTLAAGESRTVTIDAFAPLTLSEEHVEFDAVFERDDVTLAKGTVALDATAPSPTTGSLDHIDLGNLGSEGTHALTASATSGISTEAGKTRRYSGATPPTEFAFDMVVPANAPFVISAIETFDGPRVKEYSILVDGVTVQDRLFQRVPVAGGTSTYQVLVDDPAAFSTDGTARITFRHTTGNYDPSLADVWTLPVPADTVTPAVSADVRFTEPLTNAGWSTGEATVALTAADNRAGGVVVEYKLDLAQSWTPYVSPVTIAAEGLHSFSYRATDAAGNSSVIAVTEFALDHTAPVTVAEMATTAADVVAGRARVTLTANDAVSGLARTEYSVDGGDWVTLNPAALTVVVTGAGDHSVKYRSVDVAGNSEATLERTFRIVTTSTRPWANDALTLPQVTGAATVGTQLSASKGTWTLPALTYSYQWLRNGVSLGATARSASYTVQPVDFGGDIQVIVTAKNGASSIGSATSAATTIERGGALTPTKKPAISGTAKSGKKLTASKGTWPSAIGGYSYQWLRGGVAISGATKSSYTLTSKDKGKSISVRVTVAPLYYATSVATSAAKKVAK